MREVNSCCCFSLRTGGLIIGWLDVLFLLAVPACISWLSDGIPPKLVEQGFTEATVIRTLVLCLINGLMGILLVMGIYKEREVFLKSWLIYNAVLFVLYTIEYIVGFIIDLSVNVGEAFGSLIASVLGLAIFFYIWVVIYSLRQRIINNNRRPTDLASVPNI